jgi:osmotically-inducible protein OsmY
MSEQTCLEAQVDTVVGGNPYFAARRVRVATKNDCVIVEGTVSTYFQKQMAQEILLRIDGIGRIDNRLQVAR